MNKKTDNTNAERQRKYRQRKNLDGEVLVHLWVPAKREDDIKDIAEEMLKNPDIQFNTNKVLYVTEIRNGNSVIKNRYTNPSNPDEIWSGRGRKPTWIIEWIESGKPLEDALTQHAGDNHGLE